MIIAGGALFVLGLAVLLAVFGYWSRHRFAAMESVLPSVIGVTLLVIGAQNALGGLLLSVVGGNQANFAEVPSQPAAPPSAQDDGRAPQLDRRVG